jgi:hypothetical protein
MRILQLCKDLFDETPGDKSIKEFFEQMRKKKDDNRAFFRCCSQLLGGRGYNEFLDYSLFAIKLNKISNDMPLSCRAPQKGILKAISNLLHDDRHDMYQNIPYELDEYAQGLIVSDNLNKFWEAVVDAMIDCINVNGTGDISTNFVITED